MISRYGDQLSIPCSIYRGGTSKAVFFLASDLPSDPEEKTSVLLRVMGSPDVRQIDGLGGADPLTSRIGIIHKGSSGLIQFQFALVHIKDPIVEFKGFCGNIISAAGPFAISSGLVQSTNSLTQVLIHDINTNMRITAEVPVEKSIPLTKGTFSIAGVPNTGSKISLHFHDPNQTTPILPTDKASEKLKTTFGDIDVSLIHCIAPVVFVRAQDLGLSGNEQPDQLKNYIGITDKLEELRSLGAQKMGIPYSGYLPKIVFISSSKKKSSLTARMLSLRVMHKAYAISCGCCTAAAAVIPDSLVNQMVKEPSSAIIIHHPQGDLEINVKKSSGKFPYIEEITVYRTARLIMQGTVYI